MSMDIQNEITTEKLILNECLEILHSDEVKKEIKIFLKPVLEFMLFEIRPYTYVIILFLFVLFLMSLANFILCIYLLRNRFYLTKVE